MSGARERIVARIRTGLARGEAGEAQAAELRERIARHPRHIEPAFDEPARQRFQQKLEAAEASFVALDSNAGIAPEIERYLDTTGVSKRLVTSGDELFSTLEWPESIDIQRWDSGADGQVTLTSAYCGIAETGTLMLTSGEQNPIRLNFLPDYHIVVLRFDQLVPRMEDAWDKLRASFEQMPRTVNFISGPSKTADIEQAVEYGAHGPRCLHVILVG
jgi:L-lactate dehydrogenase complex protein LldG